MAYLFSSLSDNQTALLGCGAALGGAWLLLALSYYTTRSTASQRAMEEQPQVLPWQKRADKSRAA